MDHLVSDNLILAEKLRNDDPEQFYTLVKMHLSFVLDLNMDESDISNTEKKFLTLKWNLPFSKKSKTCTKSCTEGTHLTVQFIEQMRHLINFLSLEDNITQEGIFRRSGKVTRQQELKVLISQGAAINLSDGRFSVHECATVLKNILAELPESVLTDAYYPAYYQIADLCAVKSINNVDRLLKSLQLLILLLPSENRAFFQDIISLLHLAASHEDKNRMSADNLATLFTPHLLCPRKLSPEALHMNSQVMSRVVALMIQESTRLFEIPLTLAIDLQAYWNKKERRKQSSLKQMNESVCDGTAANTIFSFVDRERTAQENGANPTETALAQLYAHIQSLPESSKKRKLIKQFNKENGHGTPLRAMGGKKRARSRSLGDSIKKHLPVFNKNTKRINHPINFGEEDCNSPDGPKQSGIVCETQDKYRENIPLLKQSLLNMESVIVKKSQKADRNRYLENKLQREGDDSPFPDSLDDNQKNISHNMFSDVINEATLNSSEIANSNEEASAAEVCISKRRLSPPVHPLSHLSPTCKSEISVMHNEILHQWPVSNQILPECRRGAFKSEALRKISLKSESFVNSNNVAINIVTEQVLSTSNKTPNITTSFRHIDVQGFAEPATFDLMKTPSRKFIGNNNLPRFTNSDLFISSPNNTNRVPVRYCAKSHLLMTSTPAPGNGCIVTPIVDKNNSMSPITRSTQKMPKAMQETMMTPRSRKPVISLSGTDLCHLANMDSMEVTNPTDESITTKPKKASDLGKKLILEDANEGNASDSLSSTFRDYLLSRSVLTSPADLSFSSRTDDFLSLNESDSSIENDDFRSLTGSILKESALSQSLLYCLDGNEPRSRGSSCLAQPDGKDESSSSDDSSGEAKEVKLVYETAL